MSTDPHPKKRALKARRNRPDGNQEAHTSADALIKRLKDQRGSKRVLCGKMQQQLAVLKWRAHGETPATAVLKKAIERLSREEDQISAQIAQLEISAKPSKPPALGKLPAKKLDLSRYLDCANLTERQRDCYSLKVE